MISDIEKEWLLERMGAVIVDSVLDENVQEVVGGIRKALEALPAKPDLTGPQKVYLFTALDGIVETYKNQDRSYVEFVDDLNKRLKELCL